MDGNCQADVAVLAEQLLGISDPVWQLLIPRSTPSQKFSCFFFILPSKIIPLFSLLVSLGYCLIQLVVTLSKMSVLISFQHYQVWGKYPLSIDSCEKPFHTHWLHSHAFHIACCYPDHVNKSRLYRLLYTISKKYWSKTALFHRNKSGRKKKSRIIQQPDNHDINIGLANMDLRTYSNDSQILILASWLQIIILPRVGLFINIFPWFQGMCVTKHISSLMYV